MRLAIELHDTIAGCLGPTNATLMAVAAVAASLPEMP